MCSSFFKAVNIRVCNAHDLEYLSAIGEPRFFMRNTRRRVGPNKTFCRMLDNYGLSAACWMALAANSRTRDVQGFPSTVRRKFDLKFDLMSPLRKDSAEGGVKGAQIP